MSDDYSDDMNLISFQGKKKERENLSIFHWMQKFAWRMWNSRVFESKGQRMIFDVCMMCVQRERKVNYYAFESILRLFGI